MQIQIFTLPLLAESLQIEELNHFLRANKIIDIRKEIAMLNGNSVWSFCITYMPNGSVQQSGNKGGKIDYKEVLDEDTFNMFSLLRKARKVISENEKLPAYAVFTDAELAEIAQLETPTIEKIQSLKSIGKKRSEKYSAQLLKNAEEINTSEELQDETDRIYN